MLTAGEIMVENPVGWLPLLAVIGTAVLYVYHALGNNLYVTVVVDYLRIYVLYIGNHHSWATT